ncbi:MAG TPA: ATP-binding protein [Acetobacteraceae bacterium]|jgi:signal transduction histidine kinase|nr:ATP-binding protein [Acetobacteraceae bacterium]
MPAIGHQRADAHRPNAHRPNGQRPGVRPPRWRPRLGVRSLLFLAFFIVIAPPLLAVALWDEHASFKNEVASVRERHLLVARNLTNAASRYATDVKSAFSVAFDGDAINSNVDGIADLLRSLGILHLCVLTPDGHVVASLPGLSDRKPVIDPAQVASWWALATSPGPQPKLTNLEHDTAGDPVFYLVKQLPGGRLGVGMISTDYLVSLQRQIAFGDRGHAVIIDAEGRVIAHPIRDWVLASKDISGINAVQAMMRGETGVARFFSPAFDADMIAGYTAVPGVGWGVMVVQPISELRRRAGQVSGIALTIAAAAFVAAALLSWLLAGYLARPVRQVARTAEAVLAGNQQVSVPAFGGLVPREISRLGQAFNSMLADLRRQNTETLAALRQAELSNAAKTQFLANMSHEIRTPLNAVIGSVEVLRLTQLTPSQLGYLDLAQHSSQSLLHLLDDILDLSRIEADKLDLERAPFHLPSLVQEVRMMFTEAARAKGLTLTSVVPDQLNVTLLGDAHRLQQVLSNLVGNAIKFTPSGAIMISVACDQDTAKSMRLAFEVADTGIGIEAATQSVIFDVFTQADASTTRRYGGTGLGLSIARRLCRAMGGEISVQSKLGAGSTFRFTVVLDKSAEAAPPRPAPPASGAPADPVPAEPIPPGPIPPGPIPDGFVPAGRIPAGLVPARPVPAKPIPPRLVSAEPIPPGLVSAKPVPAEPVPTGPGISGPIPPRTAPGSDNPAPPPAAANPDFVAPDVTAFQQAVRGAGRETIHVLLVDDNIPNLAVAQAILETLGCTVTKARNGLEAVVAYRNGTFDLVLMDCHMPEMDGAEAARAIRQIEAFQGRRTPIIALTADAMEENRRRSLAAGMDDQVVKPLTIAALTAHIGTWLAAA